MKVICLQSDSLDDWYTIERAEHDGRTWIEPIPDTINCFQYMNSTRICDADVEGTKAEMLEIARAIKGRGSYRARRCGVDANIDGLRVFLWSPRNSQTVGEITLEEADQLADQINRDLGGPKENTPSDPVDFYLAVINK